jgi:hypothetical protein
MTEMGKLLIVLGGAAVVAGVILLLIGKTPLGRLPGDLVFRRENPNITFIFPVASCIIISVVLSLLAWLVFRFRR